MIRNTTKRRRGNAALELALASSLLVPAMAGTFQFGYSMYLYNQLEAGIANGARFAAMRTYRSVNGTTDVDAGKLAIKKLTVYGTPYPGDLSYPVVTGLTTNHVTVTYAYSSENVPTTVTVSVSNFTVNSLFKTFTFNNKPSMTFPYMGRYAPNESEHDGWDDDD